MDIGQAGESVRDNGFHHLSQRVEEGYGPVRFGLCIVVLSWLSEGHCDRFLESSPHSFQAIA
jgi:hypothetical protein